MKTFPKTISILLSISVVPLIVTSVISYNTTKTAITDHVYNKLNSIANIQKHRIESKLDRSRDILNLIASRPPMCTALVRYMKTGEKSQQEIVTEVLSEAKSVLADVRDISILNTDGKVAASTNASYNGRDLSSEDYFIRGRRGYSMDVFSSDKGEVVHYLSCPLIHGDRIVGVLVVESSFNPFLEITDDYEGLRTTGETLIAKKDKNGDALYLVPLRFDKEAALRKIISRGRTELPVTQALLGNELTLYNSVDYRGKHVLSATRYIKETDWGLVVKIDSDEVFSDLIDLRNKYIVITLFIALIVIIISYFASRSINTSVKKIEKLFENMSVGYAYCKMIYDKNGNPVDFVHLDVNSAFERLTWLKKKDVIGKKISEIFPNAKYDNPDLISVFGSVATAGISVQYELYSTQLKIWIHNNVYCPQKGYFAAILTDITGRKNLENIIKESEEKYRLFFTHADDAIFLFDYETFEYIDANDAWCNLYGYSKEEMKGQLICNFCAEPVRCKETERCRKLAKLLESTASVRVTHRVHKRKDGSTFSVEMSVGRFSANGRDVLCSVARDITERIKTEETLKELMVCLEKRVADEVEKNRVKDQLMYEQSRHIAMGELLVNISHHWRQPLSGIGNVVQDIEDAYLHNELDGSYLSNSVSTVMTELTKLSNTINGFRNFYKTEHELKEFDIADCVNNTLSLIEAYFKLKGIAIVKELQEGLTICLYPNEFAQVILNLLTNAKDAFDACDITEPTVHIKAYDVSGKIIVTVTNNGNEIPKEIIGKIFDPYFTTKEKTSGTGLGLYISKIYVEKSMKGALTVRNIDGGCEFKIEL
ncbi:PAS domain S-box protein [Candidatus Magnetomonas plexicatena]|uniref:PAS domain S-box protein n=1 Tax=Candidatus Magnetomonas plexicatena TaxID=2552947 RepID=UPI001C76374E|nr:PAS domain S-box protein [Nitrospirales bacterium LBB_01]